MKRFRLKEIPVEKLIEISLANYSSSSSFPLEKLKKVPLWRKIWNEKRLEKLFNKVIKELDPYLPELNQNSSSPTAINNVKQILVRALKEMDAKKLLFDQPFLSYFIRQGYMDVAEAFIQRAKKEDSNLTNEEMFQALRNVWIMNSLQLCWTLPLHLTSPMYAYSMLYPYTDNLLDDPSIDPKTKNTFNEKLRQSLSGQQVTPAHENEQRVFELVGFIHHDFPLDTHPQVTESILLIHNAQIESMKQTGNISLSKDELLTISFYKGGTSVLADAFLIKGDLTFQEMLFSFQYGAFLQLLDDLQDRKEDKEVCNQTLFSKLNQNETADVKIECLISYIHLVNKHSLNDDKNTALMKDVISQCSLLMIMEAVGKNPDIVSQSFYKKLESCSKVRLHFYRELEEKAKILMEQIK